MANTRFTQPILFAGKGTNKPFGNLPMTFSFDHVFFHDDFVDTVFNATDTYTVVKDTNATVAIVADTANGHVALTSETTTDDDGASVQMNETWLPASGRTVWFWARFKAADVTQHEFNIGLTQNFATDPEAMLAASNKIVFQSVDGSAAMTVETEATDTATSTSVATLVNDTFVTVAFKVSGTGQVDFYVDGEKVATHTTNIPATEMTMGVYSLSGVNTGTKSMTLDYWGACQTR